MKLSSGLRKWNSAAPERWQQVKAVFEQADPTPIFERSALLDRLCANDPELRREVEALLTAEDSANRGRQDQLSGHLPQGPGSAPLYRSSACRAPARSSTHSRA